MTAICGWSSCLLTKKCVGEPTEAAAAKIFDFVEQQLAKTSENRQQALEPGYNVGNKVMLREDKRQHKLSPRWSADWIVIGVPAPRTAVLQKQGGRASTGRANLDLLKPQRDSAPAQGPLLGSLLLKPFVDEEGVLSQNEIHRQK